MSEPRAPDSPRHRLGGLWLASLLLLVAGVLLRMPTLELPLEGEGARLATGAHVLGVGAEAAQAQPPDWAGTSSRLLVWLTAPLTTWMASPTMALRVITLVLGALWAPLVLLVGLCLGAGRRASLLAGVLTMLHPALAYGAVIADTASLGGVLLLGSVLGLGSGRAGRRRLGALLAALLPLAYALATPAAVVLVAFFVWRERSTPWRVAPALLLLLGVVLTPLPTVPPEAPAVSTRLLALFVQWWPVAALVVFLPGLVRTTIALLRSAGPDARLGLAVAGGGFLVVVATLALDGGQGFGFFEAGLGAALPVVPLVLLASVAGTGAGRARGRGIIVVAGLLALLASLAVVSAPVQTTVRPKAPLLAGRLAPLGNALRAAADAAGEGGWVSLDAPELDPATTFRLQDFAAGRGYYVTPTDDAMHPLPEETWKRVREVIIVSRRADWSEVTTLDGTGIFRTEVLGRHGPWFVVRVALT